MWADWAIKREVHVQELARRRKCLLWLHCAVLLEIALSGLEHRRVWGVLAAQNSTAEAPAQTGACRARHCAAKSCAAAVQALQRAKPSFPGQARAVICPQWRGGGCFIGHGGGITGVQPTSWTLCRNHRRRRLVLPGKQQLAALCVLSKPLLG